MSDPDARLYLLDDDERRRLDELEQTEQRSKKETLDLAVLLMAAKSTTRAIDLLEGLLFDDELGGCARLWWSYLAVHAMFDQAALKKAVELLRPLLTAAEPLRSAASIVLAQVYDAIEPPNVTGAIRVLESSVETQPTWAANRAMLAELYERRGLEREALEQWDLAIQNEEHASVPPDLGPVCRIFERVITGRSGTPFLRRLMEERRKLRR